MLLGDKIRELRKKKGLTLRSLAQQVQLDFTYLSKIENGKLQYSPSVETIRSLAKALDADELELLRFAEKVPPELERLAANANAREFFHRVRSIPTAVDWKDLLEYLDKRHAEKKADNRKNKSSRKP